MESAAEVSEEMMTWTSGWRDVIDGNEVGWSVHCQIFRESGIGRDRWRLAAQNIWDILRMSARFEWADPSCWCRHGDQHTASSPFPVALVALLHCRKALSFVSFPSQRHNLSFSVSDRFAQ